LQECSESSAHVANWDTYLVVREKPIKFDHSGGHIQYLDRKCNLLSCWLLS